MISQDPRSQKTALQRPPGPPARLWFEYWIALSRRNASAPIRGDLARVGTLFSTLLADAGHPRPAETADLVVSWLLGAVVKQDVTSDENEQPGRRELQRLVEGGCP